MDTQAVLELMKNVAAEVITPRFRSLASGEVIEKNPGDLVTVADREAEILITRRLTEAYPDAVVLGEEAHAADASVLERYIAAEHAFTVDPVDGTKNFVSGSRDHAVMIAETRGGETVRGWIWQPEHRVAWVAERGAGVERNGERMTRDRIGADDELRGATSIWSLRGHALAELTSLKPSWVCCGVDYPKLIEGEVDYILYSRSNPWDHAPGSLMVREAGGYVGHLDGLEYHPRSTQPGLIVAADRTAYTAVARRLPHDVTRH